MITQARIEGDLKPAGLDWITALRAPSIHQLAAEGGPLQLSLFDERDLAEIESQSSRANASSSARTTLSPRNAGASGTNCSMPPSKT